MIQSRKKSYYHLRNDLIVVMCDALDLKLESFGSATMRKTRNQKGVEPDNSYYLKNAPHLLALEKRGERIDVNYDPPPDLALEVDITHGSLSKFPIYAGLGVPEVWRYDGQRVEFYRLVGDAYFQIHTSAAFPFLTPEVMAQFLRLGEAEGHTKARRAMREWATANKPE
jgi:Uma2 family endonuclease